MKKTSQLLSFTATMAGAALVVPVLQTQAFAAEDEIQTAAVSNPGAAALAPEAIQDPQTYASDAAAKVEASASELEAAEKQESSLAQQIEPVQNEADARYDAIMNEVQDAQDLMDQNNAEFKQVNQDLNAVRKEQEAIQDALPEAEAKIPEADAAVEAARDAAGNLGDEDLKQAQDAVGSAQTGADKANAAADQAQTDFNQADAALKNEQNLIGTSQDKLAEAEKKVQELPGQIEEQNKKFNDQAGLATEEIDKHKNLLPQLEQNLKAETDKLPALKEDVALMEETVKNAEAWVNSTAKAAETARAEYDKALSVLEEAKKALSDCEELEKQEGQDLAEAEKALKAAEAVYDQAQNKLVRVQNELKAWQDEKIQLDKRLAELTERERMGSAGFFASQITGEEYDEAAWAYAILTAKDVRVQDNQQKDYSQYVKLGEASDATSLENMKMAVDRLNAVNEYRQLHNQTEGTKLPDLKVSHYLMAVAQYQMGYSQYNIGHTQAFYVGENLAWNYLNPFDGWYTEEKELYDELKAAGKLGTSEDKKKYGHYKNIVNSDYTTMGFAFGPETYAYGQTFDYREYGQAMSAAEYQKLFYSYYNGLYDEMARTRAALNALDLNRGAELEQAVREAQEALAAAEKLKAEARATYLAADQNADKDHEAALKAAEAEAAARQEAEAKEQARASYQYYADEAVKVKKNADDELMQTQETLAKQEDKVASLSQALEDEKESIQTMEAIQTALFKGEKTDLSVDNAVFQEWLTTADRIQELEAEQKQNQQDILDYKQTISESTKKLPVLSADKANKQLALQAAGEAAQKAQTALEKATAEAARIGKLVGDVHTAEEAAQAARNHVRELEKRLEELPAEIEKREEQIRVLDEEYDELVNVVKKKEALENEKRGVFVDVDKYLDLKDWLEEKDPQLEAARDKLAAAKEACALAFDRYEAALKLLGGVFSADAMVRTDTVHGVTVTWQTDAFKENPRLVVKPVSSADHTTALKSSNVAVYDIHFENEKGETIESTKPILISIAIPQGFAADKLAVHHHTDGSWHPHEAKTENGKVTFAVSHNSLFALVDTRKATSARPGSTAPGPDGTKTDSSASSKPNTSKNDGKTSAGVTSVKPASTAGSAGNKTSPTGTGTTASNGKTSPNTAAVASSALPLDMLVLCCGTGLLGAFEVWRRKQNI